MSACGSDDFKKGPGSTILAVEAGEAVPWTQPTDLHYRRDRPLPSLGGIFTGDVRFRDFGKIRDRGFHAGMGDGSVPSWKGTRARRP